MFSVSQYFDPDMDDLGQFLYDKMVEYFMAPNFKIWWVGTNRGMGGYSNEYGSLLSMSLIGIVLKPISNSLQVINSWEQAPVQYTRLDVRSLLQDDAITEVCYILYSPSSRIMIRVKPAIFPTSYFCPEPSRCTTYLQIWGIMSFGIDSSS